MSPLSFRDCFHQTSTQNKLKAGRNYYYSIEVTITGLLMLLPLLTGTVLRQFDRQLIEEFRNCSDGEEPSCFCSPGFARRMLPLSEEKCHSMRKTISASKFKLHSPYGEFCSSLCALLQSHAVYLLWSPKCSRSIELAYKNSFIVYILYIIGLGLSKIYLYIIYTADLSLLFPFWQLYTRQNASDNSGTGT